ncbi:DUF6301 family protein [Nocardia sp. NPDC059239]|uniref:DUF6301 family protein n=1 Tax=unclassified Nocardia TaxID=2637762 RepID=UPI0036C1C5E3
MQVDIAGAVRIARLAADFEWTWTVENLKRFYREAGWQSESDQDLGGKLRTGLMVSVPCGYAEYAPDFFRDYVIDEGEVEYLLALVTDMVEDTSRDGHIWLVDAFVELADQLALELGTPLGRVTASNPRIAWILPRAVLFLSVDTEGASIRLKIVNLAYQDWLDGLVDDEVGDPDEYEEARASAADGDDTFPHTWPALAMALALSLSRLPIMGELTLIAPTGTGAWFTMGSDELTCDVAPTVNDRAKGKVSAADRERWARSGWARTPMNGGIGWGRTIEWPARYGAYEALADAAITALRDGLGVTHPSVLELCVKTRIAESGSIPKIIAAFDHEY